MTDQPLRFSYVDAKGVKTRRALSKWTESDAYIKGIQEEDGGFRTFRKAQIIETFSSADEYLACPLPGCEIDIHRKSNVPRQEKKNNGPEIAFTGFPAALRKELETRADQTGMLVRKSVTVGLSFLCTGPNAGPKKVAAALGMGVVLMDQEAFRWMLETGEIPI